MRASAPNKRKGDDMIELTVYEDDGGGSYHVHEQTPDETFAQFCAGKLGKDGDPYFVIAVISVEPGAYRVDQTAC